MSSLELLISERKIQQSLKKVSKQLSKDYKGEEVTLIMVMKGSICLVADLMRHLTFPTQLEFISASSYGPRGIERGDLLVKGVKDLPVENKHLLIIDDVYQSGSTLYHVVCELQKQPVKSVKSLVLLFKDIPRDISYIPDYFLFKVGNPFVVGYGMDYKEYYRGLPGIYIYHL